MTRRLVMAADDDRSVAPRSAVSLPWLAGWRWWAVAGQLLAVTIVHFGAGVALPFTTVLPLIGVTAVTNAVLVWRLRSGDVGLPRWIGGGLLSLDTIVLTGLLAATGGASNPFSILYLVHITLGAVVLGARWTWSLTALAIGCYGTLFLATSSQAHHQGGGFSLHLQGMWIAFAVAAALTAYFVVALADALDRRDAELAAIREQAARNERLASLTTLAAGAAHALGSPLATIAVAAKELMHEITSPTDGASTAALGDARLIRAEVERCRSILDKMVIESGDTAGEAPTPVRADEIGVEVMRELRADEASRVRIAGPPAPVTVRIPRRALAQAAANLLRNALDATKPDGVVAFAVELHPNGVHLVVSDQGIGMSSEVLARAVEPFFTTKPVGSGLGLGLFLARTLAESLGGRLVLQSAPGTGTRAVLELPTQAIHVQAG